MIIKTVKSSAVEIQEYQGEYSIVAGYESKDGSFKLNWVRGTHWDRDAKGPVLDEGKNIPLKIKLGNKERAIEVLEALLWELRVGQEAINQGDDSDIPF